MAAGKEIYDELVRLHSHKLRSKNKKKCTALSKSAGKI